MLSTLTASRAILLNPTRVGAGPKCQAVAKAPARLMASSSSEGKLKATNADHTSPATVERGKPKRESLRSWIATLFGGNLEPADPKDGPINVKEIRFPDTVEHATGEDKLMMLALEQGFVDPYSHLPVLSEGRGLTKDNPVPIESHLGYRLVACSCEHSQTYLRFTYVYDGEPKRCECGYWMKLVEAPRFWEHIPKEELLQIPYFQQLEMEGKLDKVLSGEHAREQEAKQLEAEKHGHH